METIKRLLILIKNYNKNKKLLILDLNKTLLYRLYKFDKKKLIPKRLPDFGVNNFNCYLRPNLEIFLNYVFDKYDVAVWTSATLINTTPLIQHIFGDRNLKFIFTRENCSNVKEIGDYSSIKDLSKITDYNYIYNLNNIIVIEDSTDKYLDEHKNVVKVIDGYFGDTVDNHLLEIIKNI